MKWTKYGAANAKVTSSLSTLETFDFLVRISMFCVKYRETNMNVS